jgi:hypothetical protein
VPRLISHPRSYPFHLHLVRSLVHLTRHTRTYIPLAPHLLPILTATLSSTKSKASTLRPLDLEITLRAPQQYLNSHVYTENVTHEATFLTAEWLSVSAVHGSIAFPEVVVPIVACLRRALKTARAGPKVNAAVKMLVERIEESARWISQRRAGVTFAPGETAAVGQWEADLELDDAPLIKYVRVLRKTREKQRKLVEKVSVFSWPFTRLGITYQRPVCGHVGAKGRGRSPRRRVNGPVIPLGCLLHRSKSALLDSALFGISGDKRALSIATSFSPLSQPRVRSCSVPVPWHD